MHTLPDLPYDYKALDPIIDEQTMHIHHDKHHAAYVDNLNKALTDYPNLQEKTIEELLADLTQVPEKIRQAVVNHGGGHYNHSLFWNMMTGEKGQAPSSQLAEAIDKTFGSIDSFKEKFGQAGMARFGSGWAWLVVKDGILDILSTANQDTPLSQGYTPILGLDVWEHAYYLTYQNRRAEYIESWWNIVHWDFVSKEFSRVS